MAEEAAPRLREANREQLRMEPLDVERLIGPDHGARAIWRILEGMELSRFRAPIKAREGGPGRDATDPKILLALWIYGLSQGVASARELERLTTAHDAYQWICGGVRVNYHTLSDFRVEHGAALDDLMSQVLAVLTHGGFLQLQRVAQDGTRVRASAGAASFRRQPTLQDLLKEARAHIEALKQEADSPDTQRSARVAAARQRAAREREQRLVAALAELKQLSTAKRQAKNHPQRRGEVRASTTDPQARVMKVADGGFRPAYNLQYATDTEARIVVGIRAINQGSDNQQLAPMVDDIKRRTGKAVHQHLADNGYMNFKAVEQLAEQGIEVYVPLREHRTYHVDPYAPQPRDSKAIAEYRLRMASAQGKELYKLRAATAETVNADLRTWRGLDRLPVRGLSKVLIVATWSALVYNLMRAINMKWL
jgi:transposase